MKKILYSLAAVSMLLVSGCTDDPDQPKNTNRVSGTMPTVIIPDDVKKPAEFATDILYTFTNYYNTGAWTVGVSNIHADGLSSLSFTTPELSPSTSRRGMELNYYSDILSAGTVVKNIRTIISDSYYYHSDYTTPPLGVYYIVGFNAVNSAGQGYNVRTFVPNTFYKGNIVSTYTTAEGDKKTYTTSVPVMNIVISSDLRSAALVIYNARFAEEMPAISRMAVSNLKIEPDRLYGYRISGNAIDPMVGEGDHSVAYPQFKFYDVEFHPTNPEMTQGQLSFKVGDRYSAVFRGSFLPQ